MFIKIILLTFLDEELAATRGTVPFVKTDQFKALNVGIDIDEGFPANTESSIHVTHAEKSIWRKNKEEFNIQKRIL